MNKGYMEYKVIRAVYMKDTIRVYQAYSKEIAEEAVRTGAFRAYRKVFREKPL